MDRIADLVSHGFDPADVAGAGCFSGIDHDLGLAALATPSALRGGFS